MNFRITLTVLSILFISCESPSEGEAEVGLRKTIVTKKKQVYPKRLQVSKTAVAAFSKPIEGEELQGTFAVNIYETPQTFDYVMKIRYAELYINDTLTLPDLGTQPKPVIKDTAVKNACIVGFLDDHQQFRTYKLVQVKNNKLSIKAIKHYAVATYRAE